MKVAIYTDWFKGITSYGGGGEIYAINVAVYLSKKHDVTIFTNKAKDKDLNYKEILRFYNVDEKTIEKLKIKHAGTIGWEHSTRLRNEILVHYYIKWRITGFDLFINCSDSTMNGFANDKHAIPSLKVVHFPWLKIVPCFKTRFLNNKYNNHLSCFEKSYNLFLPNSKFTETEVIKAWNKPKTKVLYPPVKFNTISKSELTNKENIILYVGRILGEKKILELAKAFKKINEQFPKWKLIIAGNSVPHELDYFNNIKNELTGTNHKILQDVPQTQLMNLYKKSKIFWSAKGYGTDSPILMEHFGMTTVEAMASGCVPVVINKGGQPEIVDNSCGFRWNTLNELCKMTIKLITDGKLLNKFALASINKSQQFLMPAFEKQLDEIVGQVTSHV